uniref:Putative reverse transcriptase domain-containing protein n=1 Tax=Tanacetum cinerariifolium TaxID=118510 RepID=A0A6L2JKH9_TANCI|nr:putative reverse transcriptase domain-containing protein [Tanacetum cinerariifolium]
MNRGNRSRENLEVHRERPEGNLKELKTVKVNELKLKDIPVVRNFSNVFPEDLSSLPPSHKVEFHIDLIPRATPVAKSSYCLAPTKMQELLLTQKNKKLEWGDENENAFQTLRVMLCDVLILALPEGPNDFVVYCDASNQEFSCNNSYHSSVKCAPFEALYGRKCRTPIAWTEVGESKLIRPKIIQEATDKIVQIKERLKTARNYQKSYADNRQKSLEFSVGDKVLLKVSPWKGVVRFAKRNKLSLRYIGLFEVVERVRPVAYRLRLLKELIGIHDMFHVLNLKKCLADANLHVPLGEVKIDDKPHFLKNLWKSWTMRSRN